jgi:protein phosphatase
VRQDAFVVADGMGGHQAGDVASRLTIEAVESLLTGVGLPVDALPSIVSAANARVRARAAETDQLGMGSTLVGAFLVDNGGDEEIAVVNVGDSRCYRMENGALRQVSRDHSYVQELVDAGTISAADAARHPERNVITRAIGVDPSVAADYYFLPSDGDYRFMLCSDGLSGEVDDTEIESVLRSADSPETAAELLLASVLRGEAADNITVVVVDVGGRPPATRPAHPGSTANDADQQQRDVDTTQPARRMRPARETVDLLAVPEWLPAGRAGESAPRLDAVISNIPDEFVSATTAVVGDQLQHNESVLIDAVPEGAQSGD